jgi:hypothetical protein
MSGLCIKITYQSRRFQLQDAATLIGAHRLVLAAGSGFFRDAILADQSVPVRIDVPAVR